MSEFHVLFVSAVEFLSRAPSGYLQRYDKSGMQCCALHQAAVPNVCGDEGCGTFPLGTHSAVVRANSGKGVVSCHAMLGQTVLDKQLFRSVLIMQPSFRKQIYEAIHRIRERYCGGFPVGVSVYGVGYCYLEPFLPGARSRVARCLGPFPFVTDVLRFLFAVGDRNTGAVCSGMGNGCWHVVGANEGSFQRLCEFMLRIVKANPEARIGGDVEELRRLVADLARGDSGAQVPARVVGKPAGGFTGVMRDVEYPVSSDAGDLRLISLRLWLEGAGVSAYDVSGSKLLLATTASAFVGSAEIKEAKKVWALLGDAVMRVALSNYVVSVAGPPAQFASLSSAVTNSALAKVASNVGLFQCFKAEGLSADSKACADMVEALVGVVSLHVPYSQVLNLLRKLLVVPEVVPPLHDVAAVDTEIVSLTSRQCELAAILARLNVI